MKYTKIAALACSSMLVVAACGSDGDSDDESAPPATEAAEADQPTDEEPVPEEAPEEEALPEATIGLVNLAPVPALELAVDGFDDGIAECATANIEVIERNAEGDIPTLTTIIDGYVADQVDLIATITTPAAQAAFQVVGNAGEETPVVYAVVTDPFAAGLAEDASTHEPWITGSQSLPPFGIVIDAAQEIVPGMEVMGTVYNPSESNSQTVIDALQAIADERGLTLEVATVSDSSEVGQAAESLAATGVDVFIIPTDTTVASGQAAWAQVAADNDIPLIGTDKNMAATDAAIGIGTDYYGAGARSAEIACAVVSGTATPADFDVINIESLGIAVNPAAAADQAAVIPDSLLADAEVVE